MLLITRTGQGLGGLLIVTAASASGLALAGTPAPVPTAGGASVACITDPTGTTTCPDPDLHNYDRAIGFGSLQLAAVDSNLDNWQSIDAYDTCVTPINAGGSSSSSSGATPQKAGDGPTPVPPTPAPPAPPAPSGDSLACWDVMVTESYQLITCPDGEAFIARSGIGVNLTDRHTGQTYAWAETVACGNDNPPTPVGSSTGVDKNRPIDLRHLEIKPL